MPILKMLCCAIFLAAIATPSAAEYRIEDVCATYLGTGKSYEVEGHILDGAELNKRLGSYRFRSYATYVVIFWAEDQVSYIELEYSFGPSISGTEGTDQRGYKWSVSTSSYCF